MRQLGARTGCILLAVIALITAQSAIADSGKEKQADALMLALPASAYLATLLLAESFSRRGWAMHPGECHTIDDLPYHVFTDEDGEAVAKPCGEVLLTDSAATRLAEAGLLPVR